MSTHRSTELIVGISGASGAVYGVETLRVLAEAGVKTHLVTSKAAALTCAHETGVTRDQLRALAAHTYNNDDIGARIASGSFRTQGMIIAPCSMKTLAEIANGISSSLITRAADVILKERRRLVLMARETPLTLAHIRNMERVTEMGGIIYLPVPAFYAKPKSLDEMVHYTVARMLDLFDINVEVKRWDGMGLPANARGDDD